ncbi:hypothetical protein D3C85_1751050 [compost metagenome]
MPAARLALALGANRIMAASARLGDLVPGGDLSTMILPAVLRVYVGWLSSVMSRAKSG